MKPSDWFRAGYTVKDGALVKSSSPFLNAVPVAAKKKRIRQSTKPLMNELEAEYLVLLRGSLSGFCDEEIHAQSLRFKLGNGIWYKPDFVVFGQGGPYAYEVKGPFAHRGGFENLKVAAGLFKQISWYLVWKENGQWQEQKILA